MRVWFSGRMRPCQGRDPGSIPGTRTKRKEKQCLRTVFQFCEPQSIYQNRAWRLFLQTKPRGGDQRVVSAETPANTYVYEDVLIRRDLVICGQVNLVRVALNSYLVISVKDSPSPHNSKRLPYSRRSFAIVLTRSHKRQIIIL